MMKELFDHESELSLKMFDNLCDIFKNKSFPAITGLDVIVACGHESRLS